MRQRVVTPIETMSAMKSKVLPDERMNSRDGLVDVSNRKYVARDQPWRRLHTLGSDGALPHQRLQMSTLNISNYVHFSDELGDLPLDFFRAAGRQGKGGKAILRRRKECS